MMPLPRILDYRKAAERLTLNVFRRPKHWSPVSRVRPRPDRETLKPLPMHKNDWNKVSARFLPSKLRAVSLA